MNLKKRVSCFLLSLAMFLGLFPIMPQGMEAAADTSRIPTVTDMQEHWAAPALSNALINGLLNGSNGKLLPDANLTRAQMAAMIVRAFGAKGKENTNQFTDVKLSDWYADEIAAANQMGILMGDNGSVRPNDAITREEVFAVIARAFQFQPSTQCNVPFQDLNEISNWAKEEVYSLINSGYIQGSQNRLNPKAYISRAECAQLMDNLVKQYITKAGTYSNTVLDGNVMVNVRDAVLQDLEINGDLIVGDGVGDGEITLNGVSVTGRMVVRGGGKNSIVIQGNSDISTIIVSRIDGEVSIKIKGDSNVDIIYIADGSDDVNIQGAVGNLVINASDITVSVLEGKIKDIKFKGDNLKLIIDEKSSIDAVNINKSSENSEVYAKGEISRLTISGQDSIVIGTGDVDKVEVLGSAENSRIETPNTVIVIAAGATGTTGGGGTELRAGTSATNNSTGNGIVTERRSSSSKTLITAIETIGYPIAGETLTAVNLEPADATVVYQWQFSKTVEGEYEDIPDATDDLYTIAPDCVGGYIKLTVQGTGKFKGVAESTPTKLIKETDEAILLSVFGEGDASSGGGSGYSPEDRIIWGITADNMAEEVTVDDIAAGAEGTVQLYSSAGFDTEEDESIALSFGLDNIVYVKVTSEYGSENRYYEVNVGRRLPDEYIPIGSAAELKQIEQSSVNTFGAGTLLEGQFTGGYDKKYMLIRDITLGNFEPIGYLPGYGCNDFTGELDGRGYTLKQGTINYPSEHIIGVFAVNKGIIKNLGVEQVTVTGNEIVGGLAARNYGEITRCYTTGDVRGIVGVAGIAASNWGTLTECYATGDIRANGYYGVGGGLVGSNSNNLYGYEQGGKIIACYATGNVEAYREAGGLIGRNSGIVTQSYSTGQVEALGEYNEGGLSGGNEGTTSYNQCYWDIMSSGNTVSGGGEGRTTAQMKAGMPNAVMDAYGNPDEYGDMMYENWDETIWDFGTEEDYPTFLYLK